MTFDPDGDPSNLDEHSGSLFVIGHDRLPYGDLADGNQLAEISIPVPAIESSPENLPQANFIQDFCDVLQGRFTDMEEIPKVGMQYLDHPDTGPRIHVCWGQHLQPENAASHAWVNAHLSVPDFHGSWFIGNQNLYSVNGYMFDIPEAWADQNVEGRYLATGRMRDGGQGGMGPALFAYRPWLTGGAAPAPGTHLDESVLLLYGDVASYDPNERSLRSYQHSDEWEGGAWIILNGRISVMNCFSDFPADARSGVITKSGTAKTASHIATKGKEARTCCASSLGRGSQAPGMPSPGRGRNGVAPERRSGMRVARDPIGEVSGKNESLDDDGIRLFGPVVESPCDQASSSCRYWGIVAHSETLRTFFQSPATASRGFLTMRVCDSSLFAFEQQVVAMRNGMTYPPPAFTRRTARIPVSTTISL